MVPTLISKILYNSNRIPHACYIKWTIISASLTRSLTGEYIQVILSLVAYSHYNLGHCHLCMPPNMVPGKAQVVKIGKWYTTRFQSHFEPKSIIMFYIIV